MDRHKVTKTLTVNNYGNVQLGISYANYIVLSVRRTDAFSHNLVPFINSNIWFAYAIKNTAGTSLSLEPSGTSITVEIYYINKS